MSKIFSFNNIVKGQQLIIFFIDDKTLVFKTESSSQGTRFVVFGETSKGEKVLIPAFTAAELDDKYSYVDDKSQRINNCIDWKSKTRFGIVTSRLLDVEEIYLLNAEGHLRKYDGAFDGIVCFQRSNFYVSNEVNYNFEDLNLFSLKKKVSNILLEHNRGILSMTENVSLIAQAAEKIAVSSTASSTKLLTMAEKVKLFIENINQLHEVINVSAYSQEININIDDIISLISQTELLNNLNIKTGSIFTKEELAKFKIKLEDVQIGDQTNIFHIKLNFMYKIDDNSWSKSFTSPELQIETKWITNLELLANIYNGVFSMRFVLKLFKLESKKTTDGLLFKMLDQEIAKLDQEITSFINLIAEDSKAVADLVNLQKKYRKKITFLKKDKKVTEEQRLIATIKTENKLKNAIAEMEKTLVKNEKIKQEGLDYLLTRIKLVNNVQMLSYLQKSLLAKSKEYLIIANVFNEVHNLSLYNREDVRRYIIRNTKNSNLSATDFDDKIDNLFNENFPEFVEIHKNLPLELQHKPEAIIGSLLIFLDELKEIEKNKLLGKESTIDTSKRMGKFYLGLLSYANYEGIFSETVNNIKDIELKILNSKNNAEIKKYQQQLKEISIKFWESQKDFTKLVNELMNIYFPNEKQEISLKFALEEHFLLENQILGNNVVENYKDKTEEKFTKTSSALKINQQLVQGFQEELSDIFKVSRQRIKQKLNQQRLTTGNWKVNDIISINSIVNITDINENQAVSFKVLTKNKDNFTVIIQYLNSKKQLEYKIRDITINNCGTFNFILSKEEVTFPNWQETLKLQSLINDYIIWKDKAIVEHVELLSNKLKKISNPVLSFVKVDNQNFFNNWEWEINLQKIKEKLLVTIEQEIAEYKQLIEKGHIQYEKNLKISQELRENLANGNLNFVFSENSKENIKNLNQNENNNNVTFDIIYNKYFLGSYKIETSAINFKIIRDSSIAKNRLIEIKEEVAAIRKSVLIVDSKIRTAVNDLTKLHDSIIQLLQIKKQEWERSTNHTNLNVQLQNQKILAQLKLDIQQLAKKVSFINKKLSELSNQKIANSSFYNDYLTFIRYYEKANEVAPWSIEKYLYWDKNYNIIKNNLKIDTGYDNFDDYKTISLSKLDNIKTIDIEHCQKSLVEISKTKFKKLSWWQKIINKLSWTWKETIKSIKEIKENNIENFTTLITDATADKKLSNWLTASLQEQRKPIILPIAEPWDQWILEQEHQVRNYSNLSRRNSTDSAISSLSFEEEYSYIDAETSIIPFYSAYEDINYGDLESSTNLSLQKRNHPVSRTSSRDSGISVNNVVSTNPFDVESDDEVFSDISSFKDNSDNVISLPDTVTVPKITPKLNFC